MKAEGGGNCDGDGNGNGRNLKEEMEKKNQYKLH